MAKIGAYPPTFARRVRAGIAMLVGAASIVAGGWFATAPAFAQAVNLMRFPDRPKPVKPSAAAARRQDNKAPMLLQANEIQYDYTNKRVNAVGNVRIYYGGSTLESDKVIYDEKTKRLHAEGNARLTDVEGRITYGQMMDLSDDYRDGFVDSLHVDAPDQTRFAAARADRAQGKFTVLHSGVYTACEPCKDDPKKPPFWQVRAARIIHDEGEKMIYFENAGSNSWAFHPLHALLLGARSTVAQDRLAMPFSRAVQIRLRNQVAPVGRWRLTTMSISCSLPSRALSG